jgi:uroporphyrinogen decarboxylase
MDCPKKLLLRAIEGDSIERVPFWLMRQAGRYLPEYRAVRERAGSFLGVSQNPELAAEVTLQPIRRFDMDAAIIFSDILVVPAALGQELTFLEGEGPRLTPAMSPKLLGQLNTALDERWVTPVYQALRNVRAELAPDKALIGFSGAPWTLAVYMVEGGSSTSFTQVRRWASEDPSSFGHLIQRLTDAVVQHLENQISAGADLVQIFDSWAGVAAGDLFDRYVVAPIRQITARVKNSYPDVPVIAFPRGSADRYAGFARATGADVLSVDHSIGPDHCRDALQPESAVQGLLSPTLLVEGGRKMRESVDEMLDKLGGGRYIFNLGHGVLPQTPVENVAELADLLLSGR